MVIAKQTLSFLMALRDILSSVLHSSCTAPNLKRIELATLIVQTLRMALPAVKDDESVSCALAQDNATQ